ncbi:MAG TPA: hypothetical protein VFH59_10620 [Frateuria sp.]|uniref:hypothetical protein n=1 Tax=Frateuria sp. TaxID=2211372 RepID=UPI002D7FCA6F|nr:hypothetical protein [Frateuria sp.]HET6805879.1 hypothetical protein [Frateuria sp.]
MNERERIVNRDLSLLDEAHYGGRIARAEYRARRRNVLSVLRDSHGITARNVLAPPVRAADGPPGDEMLPVLLGAGRSSRTWLMVFAAGALVCAVLLGLLFFAA